MDITILPRPLLVFYSNHFPLGAFLCQPEEKNAKFQILFPKYYFQQTVNCDGLFQQIICKRWLPSFLWVLILHFFGVKLTCFFSRWSLKKDKKSVKKCHELMWQFEMTENAKTVFGLSKTFFFYFLKFFRQIDTPRKLLRIHFLILLILMLNCKS